MKTSSALSRPAPGSLVALLLWLKVRCQQMLELIVERADLRIWRTRDREGNSHWHIYDAKTDHITSVSSDAEMRIWLDDHYR